MWCIFDFIAVLDRHMFPSTCRYWLSDARDRDQRGMEELMNLGNCDDAAIQKHKLHRCYNHRVQYAPCIAALMVFCIALWMTARL